MVFGPRYEALLRDIFHGDHLPDDYSLYLHAPTVTDPSMAPPGCGAHYVLSPVPHLGLAKIDWVREAPRYAEKILASLEKLMPGLREHVVVKRWFTPADFQEHLSAYQGSAFSVAPKLTQSAWFRPHNRDPNIPGLYLVGAGTHPGAGVPGVVSFGQGHRLGGARRSRRRPGRTGARRRARGGACVSRSAPLAAEPDCPAGATPAAAAAALEAAGPIALGPPALTAEERAAIARCHAVISDKSKSFRLASRLLPGWCRNQVVVIYAYCRHVDDAIDLAAPAQRPAALERLRRELDTIYSNRYTGDIILDAFSSVVRARAIPRLYLDELLAGMEMDVLRAPYPTLESLELYAHRVAGVVGLLLCHVMGLSDPRAANGRRTWASRCS